ncbi:MAG: cytochrome c oxidase, cbb3-type, CcoQ subunit [Sulfurimonas sp.]|nr:cytochrome c oxidase, cbb3-type, CcoQ subunit [Sulfurimonas sp.]
MNIAELQAYGYFALTAILVLVLYGYIYHLYSKREDADGHDYEEYSNIALKDDVTDTPVSAISDDKEK